MKIAIHHTKGSFSERWIEYCEANGINYKLVNCYDSDIIQQLSDCDALMWHFSQNSPKDFLFAKQLIFSILVAGKKVFPDFYTAWHFDDKVGQKYLLEAIGAPLAPTWIFYDKNEAFKWADKMYFPKVFKLRGGAGSQNVRLVRSKSQANKLICKAFGRGFPLYDPMDSLKERLRVYHLGKTNFRDILKGVARFIVPPFYSRVKGREKRYIYFQEYIPGNDHDIRIIVIGKKAFGIKRMVREGDFRASGSGMIKYQKENFNENTVELAFKMAEKLRSQCAAFDFVFTKDTTYVVEVSFGYIKEVYDPCNGYWDRDLKWYEGKFNPAGWMVENLIRDLETKKTIG
jgi:glutathione synthase/RimK-type ligase-like ATP-grasp enzyme